MNIFKRSWRYVWGRKWLFTIIVIAVIGIVWIAAASSRPAKHQFVTVKRGTISETVSVTGNTTSTQNVSLAFESGGTVAQTYVRVGDRVGAGQVLVSLQNADLRAQLAQAQANVDSAQAQLDKLFAGPREQNVLVSQTGLNAAEQTLANAYANVPNTFADAYAKANDAIRNQLISFFSNAETSNPQLTFSVSNSQTINTAQAQRSQAGELLNLWQTDLAKVSATTTGPALDAAIQNASNRLVTIKQLFQTLAAALTQLSNPSMSGIAAYQTSLNAGLTEINTATTNVTALSQTINSNKAAVAQSQAQLSLTMATSTPEDIEAQQAQVRQAQASVASIEAKLQKTTLVAPISGLVTLQNAKAGQIASPGLPLVSIISTAGFEIDSQVPEVDIGKIQVGNPVSMTLDAFPGETFGGTVFYINPAETINQGVVDYEVKVSFAKPDPRVKSGLTANLNIQTQSATNTLILPQFAILQTATTTAVQILNDGSVVSKPVTLGIHDQQGNVQVLSGVNEGDQVINIGLKE